MRTLREGIKRITIRVPADLHKALTHAALDRDISLNQLAVEALEQHLVALKGKEGHFPIKELSNLLAPAAQVKGLTEEELIRHAKEARSRIWQARYLKMVRVLEG